MRTVENTTDRLVLAGASPLFRPFFFGGLGFVVLGASLLIGGVLFRRSTGGSLPGDASPAPAAGLGVFLTTFGFFVAITPVAGRFPFRKEIVVDRGAGRLIRRDRTLVRLRQEVYPLGEVRTVDVEDARHVDGDPYFGLVLSLATGDSVTLDRFTDRSAAERTAKLIRGHLGPSPDGGGPPSAIAVVL
jgi:hypothetical protein